MQQKILLKGPVLTCSGYGEQTRFALRALRSRPDLYDIYIQPLQWGQTSWKALVDEEREWIDQTIEKTIGFVQSGGQFDISLQVTIPNEWERIARTNVGYTAGMETTKVAPEWIKRGIEAVDNIIVVSNHSKQVYESTVYEAVNSQTNESVEFRLDKSVTSVGYPVKSFDELPELELDLKTDFNFLTVAQYGPRKNMHNTLKWFVEEFKNDNVGLILKTNMAKNCFMDRERLFGQLQNYLKTLPEHQCKIYLLHGDLSDAEMHSLYNHEKVSALLALPHGEGFGLPIFEGAYSGLPVVATGWSGQLDFLITEEREERFYNVSYDIQPIPEEVVWENVIIKESMWAYPREQSAKEQMRSCYNDVINNTEGSHAFNSEQYATDLCERFSEEKMYAAFVSAFYDEPEQVDWMKWNNEQQEAQDID